MVVVLPTAFSDLLHVCQNGRIGANAHYVMPGPLLYSTNNKIKLMINERFRKDVHYVWCATCFDASKQGAYSIAAKAAPSSDPYQIYKQLSQDARKGDRHSSKIAEQRLSVTNLAAEWKKKGEISDLEAEEIAYIANESLPSEWAPLLYVIPFHLVQPRVQLVPIGKRASLGLEYIIHDLSRAEFDILELEL